MERYEYQIDELKYDLYDAAKLNDWMKDEVNKGDKDKETKEEIIKRLKKENAQLRNQLNEQNTE